MHEVSLARDILGIVREHLNDLDPGTSARVNVRIGMSAGVVVDSLLFAFQLLTAEESLQNVTLVVQEIPFRLHCHLCGRDMENSFGVSICTQCGGTDVEILSGIELEVLSIEISEPEYEHHHD